MKKRKKRRKAKIKKRKNSLCNKPKANIIAKFFIYGGIIFILKHFDLEEVCPSFIYDVILIYIERKLKL